MNIMYTLCPFRCMFLHIPHCAFTLSFLLFLHIPHYAFTMFFLFFVLTHSTVCVYLVRFVVCFYTFHIMRLPGPFCLFLQILHYAFTLSISLFVFAHSTACVYLVLFSCLFYAYLIMQWCQFCCIFYLYHIKHSASSFQRVCNISGKMV